jgi:putative drug exporter of the RND superfamily
MSRLLTLAAGRRSKWVAFAVWLVVLFVSGALNLPGKYSGAEKNESTSFLPGDAESTKALDATKRLQKGEQAPMVAIFRRASGLTAADRTTIAQRIGRFNRVRAQLAAQGRDPFRRTQPFRRGPATANAVIYAANIRADTGKSGTILDPVEKARSIISDPGGGLQAKITGGAGYSADAIKVFQGINGTLLLAAGTLVFVLLILIYRSPFFFLIPLSAVGVAEFTSRSIGYGLTQLGVTVNGQTSSIASVLVLGAGTDYALLLVARYREELHRHEDRHEALRRALRTAGPAIVASALTVTASLLCLSVAKVNGTAGLGPVGAVAILVALVTQLTLLPALLVIFGRRAFWPLVPYGPGKTPAKPAVGGEAAGRDQAPAPGRLARLPLLSRLDGFGRRWEVRHRSDETHGLWRRVGDRVARHPQRIGIACTVTLAIMCLGVLNFSSGLTQTQGYRDKVESVEGQKLVAASFPAGAAAPLDVVIPDKARAGAVAAALKRSPDIAAVFPESGVRPDARAALLAATLRMDAYSTAAYNAVPRLRRIARAAGGPGVLVGGASAVERDVRDASARDTRVIVPMVVVVVFLILVALLRALVGPLLLSLTVVLSFFASLGVGAVAFDVLFGFPGSDPSLPLYAFVFLVALGIDYNIFLMARVREETLRHGTRDGMLRGLAVTGGVITSAGIVLAGTFSVLAVLPLVFLTEIGFLIAFGVLLDTFLVRSVLVPALVLRLGDRIWWPSRLARGGGDDDDPEAPARSEDAQVAL